MKKRAALYARVSTGDQTVSPDQLAQARDIIVQRVDAGGISGAEVTTQGDRNIVVSMPEVPSQETKNALQQSSQMQFRPVLAVASGVPVPTTSPSASGSPAPGATPAPSASSSVVPAPSSSPSSTNNSAVNSALTADTPSPSASATPAPSPSPSGSTTAPKDATDLAWITPELQQQFTALDCSNPNALENIVDDPAKPLVTTRMFVS